MQKLFRSIRVSSNTFRVTVIYGRAPQRAWRKAVTGSIFIIGHLVFREENDMLKIFAYT